MLSQNFLLNFSIFFFPFFLFPFTFSEPIFSLPHPHLLSPPPADPCRSRPQPSHRRGCPPPPSAPARAPAASSLWVGVRMLGREPPPPPPLPLSGSARACSGASPLLLTGPDRAATIASSSALWAPPLLAMGRRAHCLLLPLRRDAPPSPPSSAPARATTAASPLVGAVATASLSPKTRQVMGSHPCASPLHSLCHVGPDGRGRGHSKPLPNLGAI
ncbi:hypothetical protein BRADI_2g34543v3 [Brachypodium distachyon]|uniref:Uncharacterized protein n=1 Tax=Brachypodium distachyon TaxID=15368 RepID=A0A0Q3G7J1_BRADI|nr:hypothetical protein BRADI_2g34543v3 [Brachypodium distachyon]